MIHMIYRTNMKNGEKVSQLAFGCMRLPRRGSGVNLEAARRLTDRAVDAGVNYFDTAWMYPGNEAAVGRLLAPHRKRVNIATKMPMFLVKRPGDFDKYFNASLERLRTDRVEYYLLHMLTSGEGFTRFAEMGVTEWAEREKARGRIGNFGFSFHGNAGAFKKIIDSYDWDFSMIQYNYIDTEYQAGTSGLLHAAARGVPVMVMEPLRGGKLANIPPKAKEIFDAEVPGRTPAEWGFRWVLNHPEALTVLSGMNSMDQLESNLRTASEATAGAMSEAELAAASRVADVINRAMKVPCTGCEYCLPCPAGVDIPTAFRYYNGDVFGSRIGVRMRYALDVGVLPEKPAFASRCVDCGKCKEHCPQHIDIPSELRAARSEIERPWLKPVAAIMKTFTTGRG
jgi:predicted aldo/keto reductase-like oxidoreductase